MKPEIRLGQEPCDATAIGGLRLLHAVVHLLQSVLQLSARCGEGLRDRGFPVLFLAPLVMRGCNGNISMPGQRQTHTDGIAPAGSMPPTRSMDNDMTTSKPRAQPLELCDVTRDIRLHLLGGATSLKRDLSRYRHRFTFERDLVGPEAMPPGLKMGSVRPP